MAYEGLSRISVCVLDDGGLVQVRGGEGQYTGVLPRVPAALSIGDTTHLRVTMAGPDEDETVDLLGTIALLEGGPGPVDLKDGLIFEVNVSHLSRRAIASADERAPASLDMAPVAAAGDAPDEDTLQASPIAPHPALQLLDAALVEPSDISQEALESPLHEVPAWRRSIDVERREADPEIEAALLAGPEPVSALDGAVVDDESLELDEEKLKAAALARAKALQSLADDDDRGPQRELHDDLHDDLHDEDLDGAHAVADVAERGFGEDEVTAHQRSGRRKSARSVFEATEPSGVVGTLREMALTEVVQSLGFSGKTAEIDVRPKGNDVPAGVVFLANGNVVYARCGTLEGEDAFFLLAEQRRGAFLIRFHAKAPTTNIQRPTAFLLLEALRRQDEENHERDLVKVVAEEQAAEEAFREDGAAADEDALDRTVLSSPELSVAELEAHADPNVTEPFARIPARPRPAQPAEVPDEVPDEVEYELDDADVEEQLVAAEDAILPPVSREPRPYATALPTTVFSRFFQEASESGELPAAAAAGDEGEAEDDDVSDPTFSGLKAALRGIKGQGDDTLAVFDRPVSSGSYPSYS